MRVAVAVAREVQERAVGLLEGARADGVTSEGPELMSNLCKMSNSLRANGAPSVRRSREHRFA